MGVNELETKVAKVMGVAEALLDMDGEAGNHLIDMMFMASDLFNEGKYDGAEQDIEQAIAKFNLYIRLFMQAMR